MSDRPPIDDLGAWWVDPNRPDVVQRWTRYRDRVVVVPVFHGMSSVETRALQARRYRATNARGRRGEVLIYAEDERAAERAAVFAFAQHAWDFCTKHDDCRASLPLARACWESRHRT